MHGAGLHDALQPLRCAWAGAGATMAVTPAVAHRPLQGVPARVRAPHRGQACAKAKFLLQIAALVGFCLLFSVIPLPPLRDVPRAEDARIIYWTLELSANYGFSGG